MDDKTAAIIEKLADKLGVGAEYLWEALLRQAPISASIGIVVLLIGVALAAYGLYVAVNDFESGEPKTTRGFIHLLIGICACTGLLVGAESAPEIIAGFVNPEYWALVKLSRMF